MKKAISLLTATLTLLVVAYLARPAWALQGLSGGVPTSGPGSGTVTSVGTGNGLTGGPITTTGTVSLPTATAAQLLIENAGATAFAPVTLSSDCTITSLGAITCLSTNGMAFTSAATGNAAGITSGQITPARGGIGAGTGAPAWARTYGDGNEGPSTTGSENLGGVHFYTTWNCTGTISSSGVPGYLVIFATTSITLGAACSIPFNGYNAGGGGYMGGQGGTGGGGTAAGAAGFAMTAFGFTAANAVITYLAAPATSGTAGAAGNNGAQEPSYVVQQFVMNGTLDWVQNSQSCGGGLGSAGGSGGGARGQGGSCVFLISPSITIASGALINVSGTNGVSATANTQGSGGGGGGGVLMLGYQTLTDSSSGTYFKIGGGAPGACTGPAIQLTNAAGDSTGANAQVVVTGLTTGGIDATKVTITGGSNYTIAPTCTVVANSSGITGSPACHTTLSAGAVNAIVVDSAGSGGTLTTFTTCGVGGSGEPGLFRAMQAS